MKRYFLIGLSLLLGAFTLPFLACGGGSGGGSAPSSSGQATLNSGEPDDVVAALEAAANNQTEATLASYTIKGSVTIPNALGSPEEFHGQLRVTISAVPNDAANGGTFTEVVTVTSENGGRSEVLSRTPIRTDIPSVPGSRWVSGNDCPRPPPPN